MKKTYGDEFVGADKFESVGSAVGAQMRNQGILSVIYALIGILLYVSFRFDLRYSPGAVLALVHDVSITIGVFSLLGLEFNLPIIAALLAIVGYSLNDTIVVYDRIKLKLGLGDTLVDSINISVSDCLSRTVLTSVTTFLAVYLSSSSVVASSKIRSRDVNRCRYRDVLVHLCCESCGCGYGQLPEDAGR